MKTQKVSRLEFVSLMALLMSLVALAIDAMLPALPDIGKSLGVSDIAKTQYIVTILFFGMAVGQIFFGPVSDSWGRKPAIYLGVSSYMIGCLISVFSLSFEVMLLGRALQGFGAASTRVVTMAMIRDEYRGNDMAKVMSLITMVFVLVPALAPLLGQIVMIYFEWRAIFGLLLSLSFIGLVWFWARQPETHPKSKRKPFSFKYLHKSAIEALTHPVTISYTMASALIFGAFITYLSTSQQIFQVQFGLGRLFPVYFGILALAIGASSFTNSKLVVKIGMEKLCKISLVTICILSVTFLFIALVLNIETTVNIFMFYMLSCFFSIGILFGNFNSLALEPMGHIAGVATAVVASVQTLISVGIAAFVGSLYDGTVIPLVSSFAIMAFFALLIVKWVSSIKIEENITD